MQRLCCATRRTTPAPKEVCKPFVALIPRYILENPNKQTNHQHTLCLVLEFVLYHIYIYIFVCCAECVLCCVPSGVFFFCGGLTFGCEKESGHATLDIYIYMIVTIFLLLLPSIIHICILSIYLYTYIWLYIVYTTRHNQQTTRTIFTFSLSLAVSLCLIMIIFFRCVALSRGDAIGISIFGDTTMFLPKVGRVSTAVFVVCLSVRSYRLSSYSIKTNMGLQ